MEVYRGGPVNPPKFLQAQNGDEFRDLFLGSVTTELSHGIRFCKDPNVRSAPRPPSRDSRTCDIVSFIRHTQNELQVTNPGT